MSKEYLKALEDAKGKRKRTDWDDEEEELAQAIREREEGELKNYLESLTSAFSYTDSGSYRPAPSTPTQRRKHKRTRSTLVAEAPAANKLVTDLRKRFEHILVDFWPMPQGLPDPPKRRKIKEKMEFSDACPVFQEFLQDISPDLAPFDPEDWCMAKSSDHAQMHHLKFFDYDPVEPASEVLDLLNVAADYVDTQLTPDTPLEFPSVGALDAVGFRPNKYPGYEYRLRGFKTRAEAHESALKDAKETFERLMRGEDVEPHTVRMGGRGKAVHRPRQAVEEEGTPKGRLILMLSHRDFLVCGATERQLNDYLKDPSIFVSVGESWFCGGTREFRKELGGAEKYIMFDAQKFDSSIRPFLVDRAILSLRKLYRDGLDPKYDAYWWFVARSMYSSTIIRDDGIIFRKFTGTTSGHNHNTIIQSIISQYAIIYGVMKSLPDLPVTRLPSCVTSKSLGDDTLIALRHEAAELKATTIGQHVKNDLFIDWLGDKSYTAYFLEEEQPPPGKFAEGGEFDGVQYLGKYFREAVYNANGVTIDVTVPYRPYSETARQLYYPERSIWVDPARPLTAYQIAYRRTLGIHIDSCGNDRARVLVEAYLDWLEAKGGAVEAEWMEDVVMKVERSYSEVSTKLVFKCRRYTKEEWLDLVVLPKTHVADLYGRNFLYTLFSEGSSP